MKIGEAIPHAFNRTYPALEPKTQMLLAVSLLRFHQIDALPIGFQRKQKRHLAVLGYSSLAKLLQTDPRDYTDFLEQPCERAAQELASISQDEDIEELLKVFDRTRFGFAWVEGQPEMGGLVSLRDLLDLYGSGAFSCEELKLNQVASPIFSMPQKSTLREVLNEMFAHRFRRVFLSDRGSNSKEINFIDDRRIISHIFSASHLNDVSKTPEKLLDTPIANVEKVKAKRMDGNLNLNQGALEMKGERGEECLVCEAGVVTPWDLTVKPWKAGKLVISHSSGKLLHRTRKP